MFNLYLRVLLFFLLVSPLVAMGAETEDPDTLIIAETEVVGEVPGTGLIPPPVEEPIITGYMYSDNEASVTYSDGTTKNYNAATMGNRNFWVFTRNLARGIDEPPIIAQNRIIVLRTTIRSSDPGAANVVIDTELGNVEATNGIENVTVDTKLAEEIIE